MKISFVITGLGTGGAEMMLLKVLERLSADIDPHVMTLVPGGEVGERIRALGIPVATLGMEPSRPNPAAAFRLVAHLRRQRPDVLHTWMYHADLLGGIAGSLAGVPAIAWGIHHANLHPSVNKRGTLAVVRSCAILSRVVPDRIICCSETSKNVHVAIGYPSRKFSVIPNGFDTLRFRPDPVARSAIRAELGVDAGTPLVGLFARFDPQKNVEGFLQAARYVSARVPRAHFVLVGRGLDRGNPEIRRALEPLVNEVKVHLLGYRSDVAPLMSAMDVVGSSSTGEAFPTVLGEAMSCEVPCAVTDVGDSAYIVGDTGRVVKPGDMQGLGDAIVDLLGIDATAKRELGRRARLRVEHRFELGNVVTEYERVYRELAEDGSESLRSRAAARA